MSDIERPKTDDVARALDNADPIIVARINELEYDLRQYARFIVEALGRNERIVVSTQPVVLDEEKLLLWAEGKR